MSVALAAMVLFGCMTESKRSSSQNNYKQRNVMWACMAGELDLLTELDAEGQDLNIQDPRAFNWSPLIAAIYHDHPDVIGYLISRNVQLDVMDRGGETALMWAMKLDDTNTVRLLLDKGARVVTNGWGASAFSYVETSHHREILLQWLTDHQHPNQ